jgi:hypothetical protein
MVSFTILGCKNLQEYECMVEEAGNVVLICV